MYQEKKLSENISKAEEYYFSKLRNDSFVIPKCLECNLCHFYPRVLCPHCGSTNLTWIKPTGYGTVYSTTIVRAKEESYNISLVDLDEGPRLMTHIKGKDAEEIYIGMKVKAKIIHNDQSLLIFEPLE